MRDDFYSQAWVDNHHHLTEAVDKLLLRLGHGFRRLSARQFDAPWRREHRSPMH